MSKYDIEYLVDKMLYNVVYVIIINYLEDNQEKTIYYIGKTRSYLHYRMLQHFNTNGCTIKEFLKTHHIVDIGIGAMEFEDIDTKEIEIIKRARNKKYDLLNKILYKNA